MSLLAALEILSEVDLITGATEDRAVEFAARAAAVVRAADPGHRPTTLSQAGVNAWPKLLRSDAVEIVQVHPYAAHPFAGNLDELILDSVRERLQAYRKPVLIGECGLDWAPPTGELLWTCDGPNIGVYSSPFFGEGIVGLAASGFTNTVLAAGESDPERFDPEAVNRRSQPPGRMRSR